MQNTVHNNMAKFAYGKVMEKNNNKEFRSLARSFPSTIQVNGLGAALAFLLSKSETHKDMYHLIDQWTKSKFCPYSNDELMERIVNMDSDIYRIYTNEVMNLSLWVKRFAEGIIDS